MNLLEKQYMYINIIDTYFYFKQYKIIYFIFGMLYREELIRLNSQDCL